MQNNNNFLNDLSDLANSTIGNLIGVKHEIEGIVNQKLEKVLKNMHLVTKDQFDTVQEMLIKARNEQEELKKRIATLENQINQANSVKKNIK